MESFVLAILCIAVVALAIKLSRLAAASDKITELFDLIRRLEDRLASLEHQAPQSRATPLECQAHRTPASPPSQPRIEVSPELGLPQAFSSAPPPPSVATARSISLEERLGQNWLSKIGIVLVVLGVATFLGYKLVTLGPLGKSLTGLATALILLVGGLALERRPTYRIFTRAGIGGGWALLYFTTFALYHVEAMQVLTSQAADLILMAAVAAAMVWHSLHYKSQAATALAFLLAFATVGISDITLFSLVAGALLAIALVSIAFRESWFELGLAGLCGVYVNHFLWLHRVLPFGGQPGRSFPDFFPSAALLLLYWLLFRLFYILRVPQNPRQGLFGALTATLNSAGFLALLKYQSSHPEWAFHVLLILGSVELILALLTRSRNRTAFLVLSTIASALFLAAIPFRYAGSSWTLLWLLEAEVFFVGGILLRERVLRRLGLIAGFVTTLQLLFIGILPVLGLRLFAVDTVSHTSTSTSLVTAAILFWLNSEYAPARWAELFKGELDRSALAITSFVAPVTLTGALYLELRPEFVVIGWSLLALVLVLAAWLLRRNNFTAQAILLIALATLRALSYNLFEIIGPTKSFWSTRATTITVAGVVMLLGLPAAFGIRQRVLARQLQPLDTWQSLLAHPEQPFFFAPYALIAILIAFELRTGMITLGWIALGLTAFLIAMPIGERSYRLGGLGLLLLGLVKIVVIDIWSLSTTDRIFTLIVTGAVLLLVSFLYTRYRETILKFL